MPTQQNSQHIACRWMLVSPEGHVAGAQVAGRTNDAAGDGTTTASVLAREMIHFGLQVRRTVTA